MALYQPVELGPGQPRHSPRRPNQKPVPLLNASTGLLALGKEISLPGQRDRGGRAGAALGRGATQSHSGGRERTFAITFRTGGGGDRPVLSLGFACKERPGQLSRPPWRSLLGYKYSASTRRARGQQEQGDGLIGRLAAPTFS